MAFHVGWPQGIVLGLVGMKLVIWASKDGEEMKQKYKFGTCLILSIVYLSVLYWGGFSSQH